LEICFNQPHNPFNTKKLLLPRTQRISIMAVQYSLTHPGLERLGRSYDAAVDITARTVAAVRGWQGWSRLASAYEAWALARVEAIALQDPRVRAEIQAAAQRMTSDDVR
jgi:hypothetical protein